MGKPHEQGFIEEYVNVSKGSGQALLDALATRGTAVLTAPPGSGKTTIVPLALLEADWLLGRIVVLEPRRLATRAAARRMAALLGERVGDTVGYQTRDERHIGPHTRIEVVTEGVLTRRLQHDPTLDGVGLVIFDEVHERNLPTDIGMALALDARSTVRPDLRILAMSATPDTKGLLAVLGNDTPVATSDGRLHPVDIVWAPMGRNERVAEATAALVGRAVREQVGDVLVFLPGIGEIRRVQSLLEGTLPDHVDIRPLAGALSLAEQDLALAPSPAGRRRVVAYVVGAPGMDLDAMRASLASSLPAAAMPTSIVRLEAFPLLPNGKLDRAALPALSPDPGESLGAEPPRGRVENVIAGIWSEVLDRKSVV
mgnify:CR=1 FL=1